MCVPDRTGAVGCSMVLRKAKNHVFRPVKKSDGCGRVFVAIGSASFCLLPLQGEMVYFVGRCYFYFVPLGKPSSLSVRRGRSKKGATLSRKINEHDKVKLALFGGSESCLDGRDFGVVQLKRTESLKVV